jgi:hypothetical protein
MDLFKHVDQSVWHRPLARQRAAGVLTTARIVDGLRACLVAAGLRAGMGGMSQEKEGGCDAALNNSLEAVHDNAPSDLRCMCLIKSCSEVSESNAQFTQ